MLTPTYTTVRFIEETLLALKKFQTQKEKYED